jgi:hypothetical protein
MFVCCECCVLSGRGLCDALITRPEESYRLWRVVVCDQETTKTRRLKPATRLWKIQTQWVVTPGKQTNIITISAVESQYQELQAANSNIELQLSDTYLSCFLIARILVKCTYA